MHFSSIADCRRKQMTVDQQDDLLLEIDQSVYSCLYFICFIVICEQQKKKSCQKAAETIQIFTKEGVCYPFSIWLSETHFC